MADKQTYTVKTAFTDEKGRKWAVGSAFEGDEAAIRKAVAAGQVEEGDPQPDQSLPTPQPPIQPPGHGGTPPGQVGKPPPPGQGGTPPGQASKPQPKEE